MSETLPTQRQWSLIQGGEPLIFANEASTVFEIAHIYRAAGDTAPVPVFDDEISNKYAHYGSVVLTPVLQMNNSVKKPTGLFVGPNMESVISPAILLMNYHGNPCSRRSGSGAESNYIKIESQKDLNTYLHERAKSNWDLWSVINHNGKPKLTLGKPIKDLV